MDWLSQKNRRFVIAHSPSSNTQCNNSFEGQNTQAPSYSCSIENSNLQFTLWSSSHSAREAASNCALQSCSGSSTSNNHSCYRPLTRCFTYRTAINIPYCAPGFLCSLLDPCDNRTGTCASNTSVCIIDSCCNPPERCLPLASANLCSFATELSEFSFPSIFLNKPYQTCHY